MKEFKGTKERQEPKYDSGICVGIGTVGSYSMMTVNSILPDTQEEYDKEKEEIEANMLLYSKSYQLLEMLQLMCTDLEERGKGYGDAYTMSKSLINSILKSTK